MNEFFYALLFIGGTVLFGAIGVLVGRRIMHGHVVEGHNDVLVPIFLTVGVIYAVLLGFTVVAEWEFYDAAKTNTSEEAALLVPLYRQTRVMDEVKGDEMRHLIRSYAERVVHGWDAFRHGTRNTDAGAASNEIIRVFATMVPATKARELVAAQFLQTFSQMVLDRNKRYVHATEALSPIMWVGIVIGGILTIGLSFIIYMERRWPHVLGVAVMSTLIGMLLFLVALLSRPFHGPLAIDPAPFEQVLAVFDQVDKGQ
jgi:hypothetical protein